MITLASMVPSSLLSVILKIKARSLFVNCHFWKPRLEFNKHFKVRAGKFRVPFITLTLQLFNWKLTNKMFNYRTWEHRRNEEDTCVHVILYQKLLITIMRCTLCTHCCTTCSVQQTELSNRLATGKCCCDIICSPASHHSYSIRNVFRMAITDYKIVIVA